MRVKSNLPNKEHRFRCVSVRWIFVNFDSSTAKLKNEQIVCWDTTVVGKARINRTAYYNAKLKTHRCFFFVCSFQWVSLYSLDELLTIYSMTFTLYKWSCITFDRDICVNKSSGRKTLQTKKSESVWIRLLKCRTNKNDRVHQKCLLRSVTTRCKLQLSHFPIDSFFILHNIAFRTVLSSFTLFYSSK